MQETISQAQALVAQLARDLESNEGGFGSMSASVYDTAWVSIITKENGDAIEWAFPECFEYICETQGPDGLWPQYFSPVDCILNSLSALFALVVHGERRLSDADVDLERRIEKARASILVKLQEWNVEECVHVGFEVLVPNLLGSLSQRGIVFEFPGLGLLNSLHRRKLRNFRPEMLYLSEPTTLLHSLEALIGHIDFQRVKHHQVDGSFLGSPSSTAAFLLSVPEYDEQADSFIRRAMKATGCGAVPSAYPSTVFETTWILSTLLSAGFEPSELGIESIETCSNFLQETLQKQKGVVGFAPKYLADADDTCKSIRTLSLLGKDYDAGPMIHEFSNHTHFKTYRLESNASFSANCNVLLALLSSKHPNTSRTEIKSALTFLCDKWDVGPIRDKWNLSAQYSHMLLTEALVCLVRQWDLGRLEESFAGLVAERISRILYQIMSRVIASQEPNGSWSDRNEDTAYAVLCLAYGSKMCWDATFRESTVRSLEAGRAYLLQQDLGSSPKYGEYLWVEKVSYRSPTLTEAYLLSALNAPVCELEWSEGSKQIFDLTSAQTPGFNKFFSALPLLQSLKSEDIQNSLHEASFYYKSLQAIRLDVFPRHRMADDKYLRYIPVTWTVCNRLGSFALSSEVLWAMMVISMLNYQVDEFMETVVAELSEPALVLLESIIKDKCDWRRRSTALPKFTTPTQEKTPRKPQSPPTPPMTGNSPTSRPLEDVFAVLGKFIDFVQFHPALLDSNDEVREFVGNELAAFLMAHVTHNADNRRFQAQIGEGAERGQQRPATAEHSLLTYEDPGSRYFDWVRTTSANHTSCPYSFAFFCCLISSKGGEHCLTGVRQQYLGQAMCRHLASMCRQYNDYGSLRRDQAEGNLNSLNFPEFRTKSKRSSFNAADASYTDTPKATSPKANADLTDVQNAKEDLMEIAEYERMCVNMTMARLTRLAKPATSAAIQTFIDVTDLYGQIYVARDIASRMK